MKATCMINRNFSSNSKMYSTTSAGQTVMRYILLVFKH